MGSFGMSNIMVFPFLMEEIATSPFRRSEGGSFWRLWVVQYHCFSFLFIKEIAISLLWDQREEARGVSWGNPRIIVTFLFYEGNSYLPFRGQREYPFGRSNIIVFPALFMMEIATYFTIWEVKGSTLGEALGGL